MGEGESGRGREEESVGEREGLKARGTEIENSDTKGIKMS